MMFAHNTEEVIESDEYVDAGFNAEVIHPEVDNLFTLKTSTLNICTQNVQLKVGMINKSPMGVHAHYRNICHLQTVPVFYLDSGSDNATENSVEVEELFQDDKS